MRVIVEDFARKNIENIYYYNLNYSVNNADETDANINMKIHSLEFNSYIGRYIPEINNRQIREIIYRKNKFVGYRIMYYISLITSTIHVFNIMSTKQDFNQKLNEFNFFNNYFNS